MFIKPFVRLVRIVLVLAAVLVIVPGHTQAAQNTSSTLRGMADLSKFYVGAAVYTYHLDDPAHATTVSREFNMLTPENEAKMCEIQSLKDVFSFQKLDRLVTFAEQNKMVVRGHTLVWHQCVPDWLSAGKFSRDEAIQVLRDHIMTVVGRYKGRIQTWDVVNEAIADDGQGLRDTPFKRLIGDDYIELAFRFAHEANPEALLFYNDYGIEGKNAKSDAVYALVQDLVKRGVPINGVGFQAHISVGSTAQGGTATPKAFGDNIQRIGQLGLQVQITEMDVAFKGTSTTPILQRQAADYRRMLDTCLKYKFCTAFIVWGISDKFSWLRDPRYYDNPNVEPLLFTDSYNPKPAYFILLDGLARHAGKPTLINDNMLTKLLEEPTAAKVKLPEPTKSDAAQLAPDSVKGRAYYAAFPVSITLDGDDKDWANVPRVTVDKGPSVPTDNPTVLTFAAAADKDNLYFLADVQDSKIIAGEHDAGSGWYQEDSVEFYINATGDLTLTAYQSGVSQIGIMAANLSKPDKPIVGGGRSADAKVKVVAVKTDNGYRIEATVPLVNDVWKITPKHLGQLGFQVHLNGASTSQGRDTKLIWSAADTQDQSFSNPSVFGQLLFWDVAKK